MASTASFDLLQTDPSDWGVPIAGRTFIGVDANGSLVTKQSNGVITIYTAGTNPSVSKQTSSSGTIDVNVSTPLFLEIVTITGAARVVPIVISDAVVTDGYQAQVKLNFAALAAGSTIQLYSGTLMIASFLTDGETINGLWSVYGDSGEWVLKSAQFPAA
jgi:hypothetical protein